MRLSEQTQIFLTRDLGGKQITQINDFLLLKVFAHKKLLLLLLNISLFLFC